MNTAVNLRHLTLQERLEAAEHESAWLWEVILAEIATCRVCKGAGHANIPAEEPLGNGTGEDQDCYACRSLRWVADEQDTEQSGPIYGKTAL